MLRTLLGAEVRDYNDKNPVRASGRTQMGDGRCWRDQERTKRKAGRNEMSASESVWNGVFTTSC